MWYNIMLIYKLYTITRVSTKSTDLHLLDAEIRLQLSYLCSLIAGTYRINRTRINYMANSISTLTPKKSDSRLK